MIIHDLKMSIMLKQFCRYGSVGMVNTVIHWLVFSLCVYGLSTSQYLANLSGFLIAVSFSFYANARVTFKAEMTTLRYVFFVVFMGALSALTGWVADKYILQPIITLIVFSAISMTLGFIYSKLFVFR